MPKPDDLLTKTLLRALSGKGAHTDSDTVFDALDWKLAGARPQGAPHSLFQLLNHLVYWQNWVLKWLERDAPPLPKHASASWPGPAEPASKKEWDGAVKAFRDGLNGLERASRSTDLLTRLSRKCPLEMLQIIASHNSYHVGQAALLRQMLAAWPPPSGGLTW